MGTISSVNLLPIQICNITLTVNQTLSYSHYIQLVFLYNSFQMVADN